MKLVLFLTLFVKFVAFLVKFSQPVFTIFITSLIPIVSETEKTRPLTALIASDIFRVSLTLNTIPLTKVIASPIPKLSETANILALMFVFTSAMLIVSETENSSPDVIPQDANEPALNDC